MEGPEREREHTQTARWLELYLIGLTLLVLY